MVKLFTGICLTVDELVDTLRQVGPPQLATGSPLR